MNNDLKDNLFKVVDIKNGYFSNIVTLEVLEDFNWENAQSFFNFDFDKGELIEVKVKRKNILQYPVGSTVNWMQIIMYSTNWANYSGVEKILG